MTFQTASQRTILAGWRKKNRSINTTSSKCCKCSTSAVIGRRSRTITAWQQPWTTISATGLYILLADQALGEDAAFTMLRVALQQEFSMVRQRLFLLLAYRYEPRALLRAEERLTRGSRTERALTIETLDVLLTGEQKALVLALVDESLALPRRQASSLRRHYLLCRRRRG